MLGKQQQQQQQMNKGLITVLTMYKWNDLCGICLAYIFCAVSRIQP